MLRRLGIAVFICLFPSLGFAQTTVRPCVTTGLNTCPPISASNPMPISGSFTPSGTQDVNIAQILSAAPSATNPLWVAPATSATPWIVTGSGTAGTAAAGVVTVQGITSMTPLLATLSGTNNIATVTALTAITNALPAGSNVIGHVITDTGSTTAVTGTVTTAVGSQYPSGGTAITTTATGTTGATAATLAATIAKTTFICGFTITSDATAALAGAATVTGTVTGSLNYIQNVGSATAAGILTQTFFPCIPASATNTGIVITSVAAGTGGNTAVNGWGYQL